MASKSQDHFGILNIFGRDFQSMPLAQQELWLGRAFDYWRSHGFPYPTLSFEEIEREFRLLQRVVPEDIIQNDEARSSMLGLRMANYFHPQMWAVQEHGRSAVRCFEDDTILRRALTKAARFWPNRRCWNAQCVRSVLRIFHRARVSNFRPTVAGAIINYFSLEGATVLDFCAGYGGRLLGSLSLKNRHYIGIDPAEEQVQGLREMLRTLSSLSEGSAEIHQMCAEDLLRELPGCSVEFVFSSPPYFDRERYSIDQAQSFRRYPRYSEWKEKFLKVIINESFRVLKRGGYLAINVADVGAYAVATDTRDLAKEVFEIRRTIRMLTNAMPSQRAKNRIYKWEPILIFQKR
ncbi:MAG: class I SAM-dependent methyltransferase [Acidobacteriota bacterium]